MSEDFPSYEELEAKLWMAEHERDQLRKEAHDKHWPLANACRNLLPHSDEDNVTQVWAASRKLDQLHKEVETWKEIASKYEDRAFAGLKVIADLRTALDTMTEVARLAQEAAATAETRAVTRCADLAKLWDDGIVGTIIAEAIKKEYSLE